MSLLQTVQADAAIARLHTLCQRDIRRSVKGTLLLDETHWTNLMIDRAALLLPRLQRSGRASEQVLNPLLRALRIGLSVMHLRRCGMPASREISARLYHLNDTDALREHIADHIRLCLPAADAQTRQFVGHLVDLHCALRRADDGQ